jgi:hypothetical protein
MTDIDLLDETSEAWTSVERAIWPNGPAHGTGSGAYAALKARIIAALDATPPAVDVELLAREFIHVRGAHNPTPDEMEADQEVRPCAWCRLAAEQAVEALARLGDTR